MQPLVFMPGRVAQMEYMQQGQRGLPDLNLRLDYLLHP
jgi:hypothetical protein